MSAIRSQRESACGVQQRPGGNEIRRTRGALQSPSASGPRAWLLSLQTSIGNQAVRGALPPASSTPVLLQRRIMVPRYSTSEGARLQQTRVGWREFPQDEHQDFVGQRFRGDQRRLAGRILADMAATSDELRFDDLDELYDEVLKRITTSTEMESSQERHDGRAAFGYPFSGPSLPYGPRVNFAARDYWQPHPPDNYAERRNHARNRELRDLPQHRRHEVYGDLPVTDYEFRLSERGRQDPYEAIERLFEPQSPRKRTLIHCDYLVSILHFRAFMASIGREEFNSRVARSGPGHVRLTPQGFQALELGPSSPLESLQEVRPADETDLVIGDHVVFHNHNTYPALNAGVGNAWQLENAVLVDRRNGTDYFLGHGSGRRTEQGMRERLAAEYNQVAQDAIDLTERVDSGDLPAKVELMRRFPNVTRVEETRVWWVGGPGFCRVPAGAVSDQPAELQGRVPDALPLRRIEPDEVPGLRDPCDQSRLYVVRRPVESR